MRIAFRQSSAAYFGSRIPQRIPLDAWPSIAAKTFFFATTKARWRALLADFAVFQRTFFELFHFFVIFGLTRCGGGIKKEEIFDSYIYKIGDSYET